VRAALGLGDDPIASMCELVRDLGVAVVWVTSEQVDTSVDGACTRAPRPAILVNLLEEGATWPWRARVTLAHELGHLFFDATHRDRQVLVSPSGRSLPRSIDHLERIARAFAACFLAPTSGVRRVVNGRDPTSEEAISAVGTTFGVGRTLAINRLRHVFGLRESQRSDMELRAAQAYAGDFSADAPMLPHGFRGQPLLGLLRRAVVAQKISPARARRMMLLSPTTPLPFADLGVVARAPLAAEALAMRRANEYLAEHHPGLMALGAQRDSTPGWRVPIAPSSVGRALPATGFLTVADDGSIANEGLESTAST